jgi:hypothetical protein
LTWHRPSAEVIAAESVRAARFCAGAGLRRGEAGRDEGASRGCTNRFDLVAGATLEDLADDPTQARSGSLKRLRSAFPLFENPAVQSAAPP